MANFFTKHADACAVILTIIVTVFSSIIWMNGKFNELEKELAIVKTVLIMQKIMPSELAVKE